MQDYIIGVLREKLNFLRDQREAFFNGLYQTSLREAARASKVHDDNTARLNKMDEQISALSQAIEDRQRGAQ